MIGRSREADTEPPGFQRPERLVRELAADGAAEVATVSDAHEAVLVRTHSKRVGDVVAEQAAVMLIALARFRAGIQYKRNSSGNIRKNLLTYVLPG